MGLTQKHMKWMYLMRKKKNKYSDFYNLSLDSR